MEHDNAVKMLNDSKLDEDEKTDLFEMYLEDVEEYSIGTAIEKLGSSIRDCS